MGVGGRPGCVASNTVADEAEGVDAEDGADDGSENEVSLWVKKERKGTYTPPRRKRQEILILLLLDKLGLPHTIGIGKMRVNTSINMFVAAKAMKKTSRSPQLPCPPFSDLFQKNPMGLHRKAIPRYDAASRARLRLMRR